MSQDRLESLQQETRCFPPSDVFSKRAHISSLDQYQSMYRHSIDDPEGFWGDIANEFTWFKPWDKVLEWEAPFAKWFVGGKTNISVNCLDRHLEKSGDKIAFHWEGEPGDTRSLSYKELHTEVCKFANVMKSLGVTAGDRVAIYMPMVPELAIALLACARIGAVHNVIFGGFSSQALIDRIQDSQCKLVITADGGWRRGKVVELKQAVDDAVPDCPSVENVIVLKRTENDVSWNACDRWWHELMQDASADCPPAELDAEHPLFILYTSGSTGKPKGVLHTTGGYMVGTATTSKYIFDLQDDDVYWCTADIGWITGHSYIVYGILANGATSVMYEGAPNQPGPDRFWDIVERYKVTVFYTAPTAIRTFHRWGDAEVKKHDVSSLRLLGTVGEPINPESWMWYRSVIGSDSCPIVDTWWQTETGGIMITPLPGATITKPGSATLPFFGIDADIFDDDGHSVTDPNHGGFLVIKKPWPSMLRTIYGDDERFQKQYFDKFPGVYFTGDAAHRDEDGYFWLLGRVDDVINISGHRIGTAEVESALVSHESVTESAVVGVPHEIKGEALAAFVTVKTDVQADDALRKLLSEHVVKQIGAIARPEQVRFTAALPKTRSGKIMRRLLRAIASGEEDVGDTTTLEDYSVLANLREKDEV